MTRFLRETIKEASALGMPGWQTFLLTLALAILSVLGRDAVSLAGRTLAKLPLPPGDPTPSGTETAPTPAVWGENEHPEDNPP